MRIIYVLFAVLLLLSCKDKIAEPPFDFGVYFENPEPQNDGELKKIPSKFVGLFKNSDSLFIRIYRNKILSESYFKSRIHRLMLDSIKDSVEYKNGSLRLLSTNQVYQVKKIGDSLELLQKDIDTIFSFSDNQKAKRIDGKLIISNRVDKLWKVQLFKLEKNNLIMDYITFDDLELIDSITKIKSQKLDSIDYVVKPSRREFKNILRLKKKTYENIFLKVSN